MRRVGALVMLLFTLALAGCFPGGEGWSCDDSSECKPGLTCSEFSNRNKYCVKPGTSRIGSRSTYGWFGLIFFWFFPGVIGLAVVIAVISAIIEKIRG